MFSVSPLMPDCLIECVATGRDPTDDEVLSMAQRMWIDGAATRSAFAWGALPASSSDRAKAVRCARAALIGDRPR